MNHLIDRFLCFGSAHTTVLFDYDSTIARVPVNWPEARVHYRSYLKHTFPSLNLAEDARVDEMEALALEYAPDAATRIFKFRLDLESKLDGSHEPIETTVDFIHFLQSRGDYRLFIVSNNLRRTVQQGLNQCNLSTFFERILGVDDVGLPKPAIKAFQILVKEDGIRAGESIFIGDNDRTDGGFCQGAGLTYLNINNLDRD